MSQIAMEIASMVEKLPQEEQSFVYQIVKKIVLAWNLNSDEGIELRLKIEAEQQEKEKKLKHFGLFYVWQMNRDMRIICLMMTHFSDAG